MKLISAKLGLTRCPNSSRIFMQVSVPLKTFGMVFAWSLTALLLTIQFRTTTSRFVRFLSSVVKVVLCLILNSNSFSISWCTSDACCCSGRLRRTLHLLMQAITNTALCVASRTCSMFVASISKTSSVRVPNCPSGISSIRSPICPIRR